MCAYVSKGWLCEKQIEKDSNATKTSAPIRDKDLTKTIGEHLWHSTGKLKGVSDNTCILGTQNANTSFVTILFHFFLGMICNNTLSLFFWAWLSSHFWETNWNE